MESSTIDSIQRRQRPRPETLGSGAADCCQRAQSPTAITAHESAVEGEMTEMGEPKSRNIATIAAPPTCQGNLSLLFDLRNSTFWRAISQAARGCIHSNCSSPLLFRCWSSRQEI